MITWWTLQQGVKFW